MARFNLASLAQRAALPERAALALAAACIAPIYASLPPALRPQLASLLPEPLLRAIELQLPTTSAYSALAPYVVQVANQLGVRRERAIVSLALVWTDLGPLLPTPLRSQLDPEFTRLLV